MFDKSFQEKFKINKGDFTRKRKQSFTSTLLFMINLLTKSLSIEIENFVAHLRRNCGLSRFESFTSSAFIQYRKKIDPLVFKELSSLLIDEFYTDNDAAIKLWNGFRLLSVDGSTICLPNTKELKEIYGVAKNHTKASVVQAKASVLYDVLNHYVLDGLLSPRYTSERVLAVQHLQYCKPTDLVIYDRGYPSYDLIYQHWKKDVSYLMRVKVGFNKLTKGFMTSGKKSEIIEMYPGKDAASISEEYDKNTAIKVRLIRVELPSGEIELLITSLLDSSRYKHTIFKQLYFERWKVETFYDELKNKLKIEHFSGYSDRSINQDFNIALFVSNVQTLIVSDIEDDIEKLTQARKYRYKVNNNLSYGFLKNRIVELFLDNSNNMEDVVTELKLLFKEHLVPVRPNRTNARNIRKYHHRRKPKVVKNLKDAI